LALIDIYKEASRNRGIIIDDIYTPSAYKSLFDEYIKNGNYYKDFYKYYTEEDILEAGKFIEKDIDMDY